MLQKILFIDRDGTLISEPKDNFQIDSFNKLIFEPNVILALSVLKKHHFKFVMVTNQDGLGSLKFSLHKFNLIHDFMLNVFLSQGIKFIDVLVCPHYVSDQCMCRKPKITMLKPWLKVGVLDKENSYVIGDRSTDMELAKNMSIVGIKYGEKGINWKSIQNKLTKKNRRSNICRQTEETKIYVEVNLDIQKKSCIDTKVKFLDHMLEQIATHSEIFLKICSDSDLRIDDHHTIEDIGIVLGKALKQAIGDKTGINRFGFTLPMDESVASCVLDLSGRPYINFNATFKYQKIGDLSTEMIKHFFQSLSYSMCSTIHLNAVGDNDHHIAESLFKSFGRSLKQAINIQGFVLPTSKGLL